MEPQPRPTFDDAPEGTSALAIASLCLSIGGLLTVCLGIGGRQPAARSGVIRVGSRER